MKKKLLTSFIINSVIFLVAAAFIWRIAYSENRARTVDEFENHSKIINNGYNN